MVQEQKKAYRIIQAIQSYNEVRVLKLICHKLIRRIGSNWMFLPNKLRDPFKRMALWCGSKDATVVLRQTRSFAYAPGISSASLRQEFTYTLASQQTLPGVGVITLPKTNVGQKKKGSMLAHLC